MKQSFKITLLLVAVFVTTSIQLISAQDVKQIALEKGSEAIKLMDNGKFDESIKLLKEAQKLDPDRFDYPYEIAYAHYLQKDYKGAIKILEKIKDHPDATERFYQLLGNSYDIIGKVDKAFEVYDEGLKKFPNSGIIYLEKGNVYWGKKDFANALPFYERGIEVDPEFPSNYYRAARIYCHSTEEVWGILYGEVFMNLERNSKRTSEISKLLYDTYNSQIKWTNDTSMSVSFCKQMTMNMNKNPKAKAKLPFCMVYEPTLIMSLLSEKSIDLNALDRVRTRFVEMYFKDGNNKSYPNVIFDYQNQILKAGHLEAYNHWILMKGDEDAFSKWQSSNEEKWKNFVEWFKANPIDIGPNNKFYSGQY